MWRQSCEKGRRKNLRIFSDSQWSVGILTFNWNNKNYPDLHSTITRIMETLSQYGWTVEILWTPGHAEIQGNELADKLAEETAAEATTVPQDTQMVMIQDIRVC